MDKPVELYHHEGDAIRRLQFGSPVPYEGLQAHGYIIKPVKVSIAPIRTDKPGGIDE